MENLLDALSARLDPLAGCNGEWWVAMTRPKWEQRFADDARTAGATPIVVMNNVETVERDAKGRRHTRRSKRPLFACYAFLNVTDEEQRCASARSLATVRLIEVRNQKRLADELRTILLAVERGGSMQPVSRIVAGERVKVIRGPLLGMQGVVIDSRPGTVYLQMTVIGTSAAVEMPPEFVELV